MASFLQSVTEPPLSVEEMATYFEEQQLYRAFFNSYSVLLYYGNLKML
jgi:hypothetical protein